MQKFFAVVVLALTTTGAFAQGVDQSVIARGKYLATAADCAACHGRDFSGGDAVASPIGSIYASNITPDPRTGIGAWSEAAFADALRKGRSPSKGWLYPAMPYTSYTGLADADVAAIYAYLKSVPPVDRQVRTTDLGFPFIRPAMIAWNLLNLDVGHSDGAVDAQGDAAQHGRYLAETLEHCTACHTPRGTLMGEENHKHLSGATLNGWYAPNITPDPTGIASWSDQALSRFLQTGHNGIAVAGGEMGLAVERSLSKLPQSDIADIIAYLREVPAVATEPMAPIPASKPKIELAAIEGPVGGWQRQISGETIDGAALYQGACASCHGANGSGAAGPDLAANVDVRAAKPDNLVQIIANGVSLQIGGHASLMPGFRDQMNDAEIAAAADYVRNAVADGSGSAITADQVKMILSGKGDSNWIIRHAAALAWAAILMVAVLILLIISLAVRSQRRGRLPA